MKSKTGQPRLRTNQIAAFTLIYAFLLWIVVSWQLLQYEGIVADFLEWQYKVFDQAFPIITITALVVVLSTPMIFLLWSRGRKTRSIKLLRLEPDALITRAHFLRRIFLIAACVILATALALAIYAFTAARMTSPIIDYTVGTPGPTDEIREGATRLHGYMRTDIVGVYNDNSRLFSKPLRVFPVAVTPGRQVGIQIFVETDQKQPVNAAFGTREGSLVRNGLPGALRQLFAQSGINILRPTYVLYRDPELAFQVFYLLAADLVVLAIMLLIQAALQWNWAKSLNKLVQSTQTDKTDV